MTQFLAIVVDGVVLLVKAKSTVNLRKQLRLALCVAISAPEALWKHKERSRGCGNKVTDTIHRQVNIIKSPANPERFTFLFLATDKP